ncbi:MAG: hypothetical protein KZQ89_04440 [Candidatus Thiodiazotropha sp. (ex Lucinoma kastoroae)]|nr:hypothetical protein [Candidatus Thiodiazotropha sp. (ex Lucinoma kastoroae)]
MMNKFQLSIVSVFVLLAFVLGTQCVAVPLEKSSKIDNKELDIGNFNYKASKDFNGPGGLVNGAVDLKTGGTRLSLPFGGVAGGSPAVSFSLKYNSHFALRAAQIWNDEIQSSEVGLGWTLGSSNSSLLPIRRNNQGTGTDLDDTFSLGGIPLELEIDGKKDGPKRFKYANFHSRDTIRFYEPNNEPSYWVITDEKGQKFIYGGDVAKKVDPEQVGNQALKSACTILTNNTDSAISDCYLGSVEYGVKWGPSILPNHSFNYKGHNQEQLPIAWNLSAVEDKWGNKTTLQYIQQVQNVGDDAKAKWFTKGSYLNRVDSKNGNSIQFWYCSRAMYEKYSGDESQGWGDCGNIKGQSYADFSDVRTKNIEPDSYQERYSVLYLGNVGYFLDGDDEKSLKRIHNLSYHYAAPGEDASMAKLMLDAVSEYQVGFEGLDIKRREKRPAYHFLYYGEEDGVFVTRSGAGSDGKDNQKPHDSNNGAVYGLLKSYVTPDGKTTNFKYKEVTLNSVAQSVALPTNITGDRRVLFGNGYALAFGKTGGAIVTWTKRGWEKQNLDLKIKYECDSIMGGFCHGAILHDNVMFVLGEDNNLYKIKRDKLNSRWMEKEVVMESVDVFKSTEKMLATLNRKNNTYLVFRIDAESDLQSIYDGKSKSVFYKNLAVSDHYIAVMGMGDGMILEGLEYNKYNNSVDHTVSVVNQTGLNNGNFPKYPQSYNATEGDTDYYLYGVTHGKMISDDMPMFIRKGKLYLFPKAYSTQHVFSCYKRSWPSACESQKNITNTDVLSREIVGYDFTSGKGFTYDSTNPQLPSVMPFEANPDTGEGVLCINSHGDARSQWLSFGSITDWGINISQYLVAPGDVGFKGEKCTFAENQPRFTKAMGVCVFSNGEKIVVHNKNPDEIQQCGQGTFTAMGGDSSIQASMNGTYQASFYSYDPKAGKWFSLGNQPKASYIQEKKPHPSTWETIGLIVAIVITAIGLAVGGPEAAIAMLAIVSVSSLIEYEAKIHTPKSTYSVDPGSTSLGARYLNDADTLWFITHDGKIEALGAEAESDVSVLVGLKGYNLVSRNSSTGSVFIPFTAQQPDGTWGTFVRILRNGQLGKYVPVLSGKGGSIQIVEDKNDSFGAPYTGTFITYKQNDGNSLLGSTGDWYLHRFIGDKASGSPVDYVATTVAVNDGLAKYKTDYEYNEKNAAFINGIPTYGEVSIYPGGKGSGNGYKRMSFYTGNEDEVVKHRTGDTVKEVNVRDITIVLGKAYKLEDYTSSSKDPTYVKRNTYVVDNTNDEISINVAQTEVLIDGVSTKVEYEYNSKSRQIMRVSRPTRIYNNFEDLQNVYDDKKIGANVKTNITEYHYAWESNAAIKNANLYNLVEQKTKSIRIDGKAVNAPDVQVFYQYKDWAGKGAYALQCVYKNTENERKLSAPASDCITPPSPSAGKWYLSNEILYRNDDGSIRKSFVPNRNSYAMTNYVARNEVRYPISVFTAQGDSSNLNLYYGAEDYEDIKATKLSLSNVSIDSKDSFTGNSSLLFDGEKGSVSYSYSSSQSVSALIGFWLNISQASGKCNFIQGDYTEEVNAAQSGGWQYYQHIVDSNTFGFTLSCTDHARIDDITIHPVSGGFKSYVYDPSSFMVTGRHSTGGKNVHHVYDRYGIETYSYSVANNGTGDIKLDDDQIVGFSRWKGNGFSTKEELPTYDIKYPNSITKIRLRESEGTLIKPAGHSSEFTADGSSMYLKTYLDTSTIEPNDKLAITSVSGHNIATIAFPSSDRLVIKVQDDAEQEYVLSSDINAISIALIDDALIVWSGNKLLISYKGLKLPDEEYQILVQVDHSGIYYSKYPQITTTYRDAMGRGIQLHSLDSDQGNVFDRMTGYVYDGWGKLALSTRVSAPNLLAESRCNDLNGQKMLLGYCSGLVDYPDDWSKIKTDGITGHVKDYWDNQKEYASVDADSDGAFSFLHNEQNASPYTRLKSATGGFGRMFNGPDSVGSNKYSYHDEQTQEWLDGLLSVDPEIKKDLSFLSKKKSSNKFDNKLTLDTQTAKDTGGSLYFERRSGSDNGHQSGLERVLLSYKNYPVGQGQPAYSLTRYSPKGFSRKSDLFPVQARVRINYDLMSASDYAKERNLVYLSVTMDGQRHCISYPRKDFHDYDYGNIVVASYRLTKKCPLANDFPTSEEDYSNRWKKGSDYPNYFLSFIRKAPKLDVPQGGGVLAQIQMDERRVLRLTEDGSLVSEGFSTPVKITEDEDYYLRYDQSNKCLFYDGPSKELIYKECDKLKMFEMNNSFSERIESYGFGGVSVTEETDTVGKTYTFNDINDRPRFICDNYSVKDNSNGCTYYQYDYLGRVVETGVLKNVKGDVSHYLTLTDDESFPSSTESCVKRKYYYDYAFDLDKVFDGQERSLDPGAIIQKNNLSGRLFAMANIRMGISDRPVESCGESTDPVTVNYAWNIGSQWDGNNVRGSAVENIVQGMFTFRNAYYEALPGVKKVIYPSMNTDQFEISDQQKAVLRSYDSFNKLTGICESQSALSVCKPSKVYTHNYRYYIDGTVKSYEIPNINAQQSYLYDSGLRLREIKTVDMDDGKEIFHEQLFYERDSEGAKGHQGNNVVTVKYGGKYLDVGMESYAYQYNYTYDIYSQVSSAIRTSNDGALLRFDYQYDANGNLLSSDESNGTSVKKQTHSYYDDTNRVRSITASDAQGAQAMAEYGYDDTAGSSGAVTKIIRTKNGEKETLEFQREPRTGRVLSRTVTNVEGKVGMTKYLYDPIGRLLETEVSKDANASK